MKTRVHPCVVLVVFTAAFTAAAPFAPAADQVVTYPAPAGEPLSGDYEVTANGQPLAEGQSRLRIGKHVEGVRFANERR